VKKADISPLDFPCKRLMTYVQIYGSLFYLTALVYHSLLISVTGNLQRKKRKRCEVNQLSPSRAELIMTGAITLLPPSAFMAYMTTDLLPSVFYGH
jgi:hypothetical protein